MSIYDSGVGAYRDTTKWLVAFVPLGSLIAATVTIGPDLVWSSGHAQSFKDWLLDYWLTAICGLVLLAGVAAILWWGAKVLSVAPTDLGQLQSQAFAPKLATAIGAGVTAPEFFSPESFNAAMAALANAWDKPAPTQADTLNLARVQGAVENLRQWSVFDRVSTAFTQFITAFILGTGGIGIAIILAASQLDSSPVIKEPTAVSVNLNGAGRAQLAESTGCSDPSTTTFLAVGGTWQHPTLTADGPGCRFGANWAPRPDNVELRPKPQPRPHVE